MTFFDDITGLLRVLVFGALGYTALIVVLRTSGKRTLAKLNAFDLVVTVALGSAFASAVLDANVPLAESVLAFATLAGLQAAVAYGASRSRAMETAVKSEPQLLLRDGRLLRDAMRGARVTEGEVRQVVRSSGGASLDDVAAVVLETDGTISVLRAQAPPSPYATPGG